MIPLPVVNARNSVVSNEANKEQKNTLVTEWHWHGTGEYAIYGTTIEPSGVAR